MTEAERKLSKCERAISQMYLVRDRIIEKLASSTTAAQAHIGLLNDTEDDIAVLEKLLPALQKSVDAEKPAPVKRARKTEEG